jgi:CBS domain-containing protein
MDYVASTVMQKDVKTVPPSMTVADLEACFVRQQVSGFAVVDDSGKLVGVASRSVVIRELSPPEFEISRMAFTDEENGGTAKAMSQRLAETIGERANTLRVKDIMNTDVVTVGPNDCIHKAADLMYRERIHRIFVVRNDQLLGIYLQEQITIMHTGQHSQLSGPGPPASAHE